jgi:hypothetical protein
MDAPGRMQRVAAPLLLLVITLLGRAAFSCHRLQKGIWLDEAFSVWLATHRLPQMWDWIAESISIRPFTTPYSISGCG